VSKEEAPVTLSLSGHDVAVTHPSKPYFSRQARLTKLDIVNYYVAVAEGALGGIPDPPILLKTFVKRAEASLL
jgi:bifunctional non-homologous end joining protein LigD